MKAKIWKQRDGKLKNMWRGQCSCGKTGQFWFFGATLGYFLEHHRRKCVS